MWPSSGELAGTLVQGRALAAHAARELRAAGVEVVAEEAVWSGPRPGSVPVVLHDAACPLLPAAFVAGLLASLENSVLVGVRPVTDTIKTLHGEVLGPDVDRENLLGLAAPVVLPASIAAAWAGERGTHREGSLPALVIRLRRRFPMRFLAAPALGLRVEDRSAVLLLEALAEAAGLGGEPGQ